MYYFIPAWYPQGRTWYDNTDLWYRSFHRISFDDSINQLRMFEHAGEPATMIVLNYMPNLRYYSHRYDLFEVPKVSIFDRIQGISGEQIRKIDFRQLNWPNNVDFIHSPFLVVARVGSEVIAHIEFGEEGQVILINYFSQGQRTYQYVFDDRGFLSSILFYENGQEHHQDYYNEVGIWQIREYLGELKGVDVNPLVSHRFKKSHYSALEELLQEQLATVTQSFETDDVVMLAADERHNSLVFPLIQKQQVVVSFFQNRFSIHDSDTLTQVISQADLLIADKISTTAFLESRTDSPVEHISPFDTRLSLGKSQRMKELEVLLVIDQLSVTDREQVILQLFDEMRENEWIRLKIVTNLFGTEMLDLRHWLEDLLEQQKERYFSIVDEKELEMFELDEDEDEADLPRVYFKECHTETETMALMETARLMVDLSPEPDLYTQIAAISAGVPQVNRIQTEFVEHLKNGYIISQVEQISKATRYYLEGLANWNKALVYAVQKIADYTSGRLVKKIQTKLENNQ